MPRILFVEDEFLIRLTMVEFLQDAGFDVVEAWDSAEAIRVLGQHTVFQALITDVRMPGALDGIDLAHYVRQRYPTMPIVVVSGYAANLTQRLGDLHPPATFFDKPYVYQKVATALGHLTAGPSANGANDS